MDDCIFCKIVAGELPSDKVAETADLIAFKDIRPQAPVHVLLIPKKHIPSANDLSDADAVLIGALHLMAKQVARDLGVAGSGYRLVTNVGWDAQQTVQHLHYHLIGGRQLGWPPG